MRARRAPQGTAYVPDETPSDIATVPARVGSPVLALRAPASTLRSVWSREERSWSSQSITASTSKACEHFARERPRGPMDKAPAYGAGDSWFDPMRGYELIFAFFWLVSGFIGGKLVSGFIGAKLRS